MVLPVHPLNPPPAGDTRTTYAVCVDLYKVMKIRAPLVWKIVGVRSIFAPLL